MYKDYFVYLFICIQKSIFCRVVKQIFKNLCHKMNKIKLGIKKNIFINLCVLKTRQFLNTFILL